MRAAMATEAKSEKTSKRPVARGLAGLDIASLGVGVAQYFGLVPEQWLSARVAASKAQPEQVKRPGPKSDAGFKLTPAQWQTLTVDTVTEQSFRLAIVTDGKIAIDEDHATPVFSPYVGRIVKLFAKRGDHIQAGQPLFSVEATDMVQGQNDFLAAAATVNKARFQLSVAQTVLKRHRDLIAVQAVAKRELEQAELDHGAAVNECQ